MKKTKKKFLFLTFSLFLTGALCLSFTAAKAQEQIDSPFKFIVVLQGQSSGSISTTATTPVDIQNVGILSIGNQQLTASLDVTSEQTGIWWMGLISLGTIADADFVFGVAPLPGQVARVAVDPISFALASGGIFSVTEVTEEAPINYDIAINGG
jgi:hypothetical protein